MGFKVKVIAAKVYYHLEIIHCTSVTPYVLPIYKLTVTRYFLLNIEVYHTWKTWKVSVITVIIHCTLQNNL